MQRFTSYRVHKISMVVVLRDLHSVILTRDLETLYRNSHSHDEYLWQTSLNRSTKSRDIASCEISVNGQRDNGWPDGRPKNTMPLPPIVGIRGIKTRKTST